MTPEMEAAIEVGVEAGIRAVMRAGMQVKNNTHLDHISHCRTAFGTN